MIWSPCQTTVHGRDWVLLPQRLWWFLLHDDLRSATMLSCLSPRDLECLATPSLYGTGFVIIPAATEKPAFPPFLLFWLTSGTFLHEISVCFWLCSMVYQCLSLHHANPVIMKIMTLFQWQVEKYHSSLQMKVGAISWMSIKCGGTAGNNRCALKIDGNG